MSTLAIVIDCWDPGYPELAVLTPTGRSHYEQVVDNINSILINSIPYVDAEIVGVVFATYGTNPENYPPLHPKLHWTTADSFKQRVRHHPWATIELIMPILETHKVSNILVMGCSWRACLFDRPLGLRRLFQSIGSQYNCQVIPQCCQNGNEDPSVVLTELTYGVEQNHWYMPYHYPNRYTLNHPDPTSNPPTKQIIRNSSSTWLNFFALKKQGR